MPGMHLSSMWVCRKTKSIVTVPWKSSQTKGFSMMQDVREEFAKSDQTTGGQLDLMLDALKWMQECQSSYTDKQLNFWILLWLLANDGKVSSQHLVCRLLSVWHWASGINLPTYLPKPSQLNIGCWMQEDCNVSEHQKWIEAYMWAL